jgi:RecJ-like exonuclease
MIHSCKFYHSLIFKITKSHLENKMPDESCRNCGGQLKKCTICAECRGTVSLVCIQCGTRTKEQIHALCFMAEIPKIGEPTIPKIFQKQILVA